MKKNIFIFMIGAPVFGVILALINVYYLIAIWNYSGNDREFEIKPGESFSSINYRLYKDGIISNAKIFYRYSKTQDLLTSFKIGTFLIKKDSTMLDIINMLTKGTPISQKITIPEGKNLYEIAAILEKEKITKAADFIRAAKNPQLAKSLNIAEGTLEGYLYPETYFFSKNTPAKTVIKSMVKIFNDKIENLNFENSPLSKEEVITLASIVEKETGAREERGMIAGVFRNRLAKKMRLQSDPTTIYGIYETYNGNLQKKHLLEKTDYNTYKINGLPKGPICNPGISAIKAVLNPEKHNYLYFVSQNDGTHVFSETYKQHLQAVEKFQKNRNNREGRSWRNLKQ
jgi:UPF0755 protein